MTRQAQRRQVVVVGAGVAGLAVTTALTSAGIDVACLEARDRAGGRLLSVPAGGGWLDLGATWFWPGENRVRQLVTSLELETFGQYTAGAGLYDLPGGVQRLDGNPIDVPAFRYAAGAHSLALGLAAALPASAVRLGSPVASVSSDAAGLLVATPAAAIRAGHVVMAVPPALAAASIGFGTALPARLLQLAHATPVWMGAVSKVVALYPDPFWRSRGLAGAALSSRGPLHELHDTSGPGGYPAALLGFTAGPPPTRKRILDQLTRLYGQQAASPARVLVQDWSRERYTSPPGAEGAANYALLGHPLYAQPALGGRLHWASTETSALSPGHVEGALAAAERAVAAVLTALRPLPQA